jgi:tRNA(Ile)-lysidine synthase
MSLSETVHRLLESAAVRDASVCVGLSGGIDSVVLLDVLQTNAARLGLALSAVHVNHGLSPHAAQWQRFCEELCRARGVGLACVAVQVPRRTGLGLEAAARAARYAVFEAQAADFVALAHHLDDQTETFLLQLLRGAGARGLSAMPMLRAQASAGRGGRGPRLLRPLLEISRAQIAEHARGLGLRWVEDESNRNLELDRNFLRHQILPLLEQRFPAYRQTLSRSARNMADASALADALAEQDLDAVSEQGGIHVERLRKLTPARALNALRHALTRLSASMPPRAALEEALRQCTEAGTDAQVRVSLGAVSARRYRGRIRLVRDRAAADRDWCEPWRGQETIELPQGGSLRFLAGEGDGLSRARLAEEVVTVRFRRGGEKLCLGAGRPRRTLKQLFQEAGIPAWERALLPLVFCGETLVWLPGIGAAAQWQARSNEPSLRIVWNAGC